MAACGAKNAKGERCAAPALGGSRPSRCWAHATGKAAKEKRAAARKQGGKNRMRQVDRGSTPAAAVPAQVSSQADVTATLSRVVRDVWAGKMDPRSANAITGALQIMLRPGLLAPTGAYADFFDQFEEVEMVVHRDGSAGDGVDDDSGPSSCYGVMKNGTRVLLTGDLALAAWQRLRTHDGAGIEWVGGANVEPETVDIKVERRRNPTVPSPEEKN